MHGFESGFQVNADYLLSAKPQEPFRSVPERDEEVTPRVAPQRQERNSLRRPKSMTIDAFLSSDYRVHQLPESVHGSGLRILLVFIISLIRVLDR